VKTQIKLTEAIGRTLTAAEWNWRGGELLLAFSDDAFALLEVSRGYEAGDEEICDGHLDPLDFGDAQLVRAGVFTEAQLNTMRAEKRAAQAATWDEHERQLYERLREKFGDRT